MPPSTPTAASFNVAVIRGVVSSSPRVRRLPSDTTITNIEVTTRVDDERVSVPVVVHDRPVAVAEGDEVVVCGHIARRFFRAGGVTQSRTELIATDVHPTSRTKTIAKALARSTANITP